MDPLTHCLVGAVASQAFFARRLGRLAPLIGAAAGGLADLDVLIHIPSDPTAWLVYHRHFTHALLFIPVGAMLAALPFLWIPKLRYRRPAVIGACLVAYALHGVVDACTSYGTLLFWPFSNVRVSLDWISIIDPVFTLILLAGVIAGLVKVRATFGRVALIVAALYMGIAAAQHERAMNVQKYLAEARSHEFTRSRAMPTLGNLVVWRSIYEVDGRVYADAIRLPWGSEPTWRRGDNVRLFAEKDLPEGFKDTPQDRHLRRFLWFTDGWASFVPDWSGIASPLVDMRYTHTPEGVISLWGMKLDAARTDQPPVWVHPAPPRAGLRADLWNDIIRGESNGRRFVALPAHTSAKQE